MENQITLVQSPIIKHDLKAVGASVSKRINDLDIKNQVATTDTIKFLKELRATLNKEFKEFEDQRKAVSKAINAPCVEFTDIYKAEIATKYKSAVDVLKDTIGTFEASIKLEKQVNIEIYYAELCQAEKIDFIKFEQLGIKIDLSTSEKKYKEQCNAFIEKVLEDMKLIESEEFQAEIMAEFKSTLNASKAITEVRARKAREKEEAERIRRTETMKRESKLRSLGMIYSDITRSFLSTFDDQIFVKQSDIESLDKEEFLAKFVEVEAKVNEIKAKAKQSEPAKPETVVEPKKEVKKPLEAPKEVIKEEVLEATFQCSGTMRQLIALGEYMKANGITYKNI